RTARWSRSGCGSYALRSFGALVRLQNSLECSHVRVWVEEEHFFCAGRGGYTPTANAVLLEQGRQLGDVLTLPDHAWSILGALDLQIAFLVFLRQRHACPLFAWSELLVELRRSRPITSRCSISFGVDEVSVRPTAQTILAAKQVIAAEDLMALLHALACCATVEHAARKAG